MFKVDFSILARFHNEDVRRPIPVILLECLINKQCTYSVFMLQRHVCNTLNQHAHKKEHRLNTLLRV